MNLASYYGLEARDPTCDKRLLEFCFAIPDQQYRNGNEDRRLIRRAMAGLLPDEVRLNHRIGRQAADLVQRVHKTYEEIETTLRNFEQSDLVRDYLNLELMNTTLRATKTSKDLETLNDVVTILMRGLSAGLFLLSFNHLTTDSRLDYSKSIP